MTMIFFKTCHIIFRSWLWLRGWIWYLYCDGICSLITTTRPHRNHCPASIPCGVSFPTPILNQPGRPPYPTVESDLAAMPMMSLKWIAIKPAVVRPSTYLLHRHGRSRLQEMNASLLQAYCVCVERHRICPVCRPLCRPNCPAHYAARKQSYSSWWKICIFSSRRPSLPITYHSRRGDLPCTRP